MGADRRAPGHIPDPGLPQRPPPLASVAVVRMGPRYWARARLPGDPLRSREAGEQRGPRPAEPPRPRVAPPGPAVRACPDRPASGRHRRVPRQLGPALSPLLRHRAASAEVVGDSGGNRGRALRDRHPDRPRDRMGSEFDAPLGTGLPGCGDRLLRPDPDHDRCLHPSLSPPRHRHRDQPRAAVWGAGDLHHGRLRLDRGRRRRAGGKAGEPCTVRRRRRGRSASLPAGAPACAALGRPARVRKACDPVRSALGVLRTPREGLRERRVAPQDGISACGGHRCRSGRRVGAHRRSSPAGG